MPPKRTDRKASRGRSTIILLLLFIVCFAVFALIDAFTVLRDLPIDDHSTELSLVKAQLSALQDEVKLFQMMLDELAIQNQKLHTTIEKNEYQPYEEESDSESPFSKKKQHGTSMRNVFFDLGANRGDSTRIFVGIQEPAGVDEVPSRQLYGVPARISGGWEIRIYEANPDFDRPLKALQDELQQMSEDLYGGPFDVQLFSSTAIGTREGVTDFFLDRRSKESSLRKDHPNANGTSIQVPVVDLTKELLQNYQVDDYIIINMEIEGYEYELLMDLLVRGAFPFIDELYVKCHAFSNKNNIKESLSKILSFAEVHMRVGMWQ